MLRGVFAPDGTQPTTLSLSIEDATLFLLNQEIAEEDEIQKITLAELKSIQLEFAFIDQLLAQAKQLPIGKYSIILATGLFMVVCGMTTGGFVYGLAGSEALGWTFSIISGNAQKSIFLAPLTDGWKILCQMKLHEFLTWDFFFVVISTLGSGLINFALASTGAEIFIISVLGIAAGPPGWLMLAFAIFFGVMNALLVFNSKMIDLNAKKTSTTYTLFLKVAAFVISMTGLIMTFYPGVNELKSLFSTDTLKGTDGPTVLAWFVLTCTLWIEGCFAYKKITHLMTESHMPDFSASKTLFDKICVIFNKICDILNACSVFFIAAEGGKIFAEECGVEEKGAEQDAIIYVAGTLGTVISYAYTMPSPKEEESTQEEQKEQPIAVKNEKQNEEEQPKKPTISEPNQPCTKTLITKFTNILTNPEATPKTNWLPSFNTPACT